MKRFYREAAAVAAASGYAVMLDGKPVKTPAKAELAVGNQALAQAIAEEWQNQGDTIIPLALPLTRLVSTAIDRVTPRRDAVVADIAKYAETDLLCYRAEEPPELVRRQHEAWQPLLDWAHARFDAQLAITHAITPVPQPAPALAALARAVQAHDVMMLVALHLGTSTTGSLIVGLALVEGKLSPDEAFAIAELDETYEIERWGEDVEQAKRRAGLKEDIALAARFAALLRGG